MTDTDYTALSAILAKRAPGECRYERVLRRSPDLPSWLIVAVDDHGESVAIAEFFEEEDAKAFAAAVNAIGPLLERVAELTERRKSALARYGEAIAENANMESTFEREATIANNNIQVLEAENKRLLERVRELEALSEQKGFALDELNTQLAAANERIEGLEAKLQTQMGAFCEAIKECERLEAANVRLSSECHTPECKVQKAFDEFNKLPSIFGDVE